MSTIQPIVGIIMGSDSDLTIMQDAANILKQFNIPFELTVVSAHRTPIRMVEYATTAKQRGLQVIIAGAGGAIKYFHKIPCSTFFSFYRKSFYALSVLN